MKPARRIKKDRRSAMRLGHGQEPVGTRRRRPRGDTRSVSAPAIVLPQKQEQREAAAAQDEERLLPEGREQDRHRVLRARQSLELR